MRLLEEDSRSERDGTVGEDVDGRLGAPVRFLDEEERRDEVESESEGDSREGRVGADSVSRGENPEAGVGGVVGISRGEKVVTSCSDCMVRFGGIDDLKDSGRPRIGILGAGVDATVDEPVIGLVVFGADGEEMDARAKGFVACKVGFAGVGVGFCPWVGFGEVGGV